jgi:hypothetical protein
MSGKATHIFDRAGFPSALVLTEHGSSEVLVFERDASKLEQPDNIGSDILRTVVCVPERMSE